MYILGMGCAHPKNDITNQFLEELDVGTTADWIDEYIGIKSRKSSLPLDYIKATKNADPREAISVATHTPSDLGLAAAEQALERAGISAADVGMVLCNCATPNTVAPTEGQKIAKRLGIDNVPTYDVFTACPAFALHVDFISNFKDAKLPEYVLCISTATLTQKVNYTDRTDGAIWGDGAAAYVLSSRNPGKLKVEHSTYTTDPMRCEAVVVDTYGYFHQDGRAVRNFSVLQTVKLVRAIEKKFDIDWSRDTFIGHQANRSMLQQICNNRGIDDEHHWHNVEYIGNQAGASAPAVLAGHWDDVQPGQNVVVGVVGAGLSWGSLLLSAQS